MDEIKLFGLLQPPPPPDAARIRENARARLTAAANAPLAHPARRRVLAVGAVAAAAAVMAAGTGYGLTIAQRGTGHLPGGRIQTHVTAAGLSAVHGCAGEYITAGTLKQVSGTRLVIQPANDHDHHDRAWRAHPVIVVTTRSTVISRPAPGKAADITDGSKVVVQGSWSGGRLAAAQVGIEKTTPVISLGPPTSHHPAAIAGLIPKGQHLPRHARRIPPAMLLHPSFATGTVTGAHDGSFTVIMYRPFPGLPARIRVTTSSSTSVETKASIGPGQLNAGVNVVVVGRMGPHGVLTASVVEEPPVMGVVLAGAPTKLRPRSCSASAITTAAVLAGR